MVSFCRPYLQLLGDDRAQRAGAALAQPQGLCQPHLRDEEGLRDAGQQERAGRVPVAGGRRALPQANLSDLPQDTRLRQVAAGGSQLK